MLIAADPQIHLQVRRERSAWNGVFNLLEPMHTAQQQSLLSENVRKRTPALPAGEIDTYGFFDRGLVEAACTAITSAVAAQLVEFGWLAPDVSRESFLWNTKLMRTRGAPFHHDGHNRSWHQRLFWVYVVEADGVEMRMPNLGLSLPLQSGQLIVFDPLQPHAVVKTDAAGFSKRHFDRTKLQVFLAGDMAYSPEFFGMLGLETRPAALAVRPYQDLESLMVEDRSGDIIPRNYAAR